MPSRCRPAVDACHWLRVRASSKAQRGAQPAPPLPPTPQSPRAETNEKANNVTKLFDKNERFEKQADSTTTKQHFMWKKTRFQYKLDKRFWWWAERRGVSQIRITAVPDSPLLLVGYVGVRVQAPGEFAPAKLQNVKRSESMKLKQ